LQFCGLLYLSLITLGIAAHALGATAAVRATTRHPARKVRNGKVILVPTLQRTIVQQFPGFYQVGDFVEGDFDGNGRRDVALYLTNRHGGLPFHQSTWLFVAFHQMPSSAFRFFVIARRRDPSTQRDPDYHGPGRFDDYLL
jgi:hypothetical protein